MNQALHDETPSDDVFAGLLEVDTVSPATWEFNRWVAAGLVGMSLLIITTVIGAGLKGWLTYTAVSLLAVALAPLASYLLLESERTVVRLQDLNGAYAVGQLLSFLGLLAFMASYSWVPAVLLVIAAAGCLWWLFHFIPSISASWSSTPILRDPRSHRTKMARLRWAIKTTMDELHLSEDRDFRIDFQIQSADYDGKILNKVHFASAEVAARFQEVLRRKLKEAAELTRRA